MNCKSGSMDGPAEQNTAQEKEQQLAAWEKEMKHS